MIDDFSTGKRENVPSAVKIIEADISQAETFQDIGGIEACFHLAAVSSVEKCRQNWAETHKINAGGFVQLYDALIKNNKKIPVIFASSAAVYGASQNLPLSEDEILSPMSAYGADKASCETNAKIAALLHGIPSIGLRFFNVYGERQDPASPYSGVVSIFKDRISKGEAINIYGDGSDSRDFIHVSDVIRGLQLSLKALQAKKINYGIFNICTGQSVSILNLADTLAKIFGKPLHKNLLPARAGNIPHSCGDPRLAEKLLGFKASLSLEEGLRGLK